MGLDCIYDSQDDKDAWLKDRLSIQRVPRLVICFSSNNNKHHESRDRGVPALDLRKHQRLPLAAGRAVSAFVFAGCQHNPIKGHPFDYKHFSLPRDTPVMEVNRRMEVSKAAMDVPVGACTFAGITAMRTTPGLDDLGLDKPLPRSWNSHCRGFRDRK